MSVGRSVGQSVGQSLPLVRFGRDADQRIVDIMKVYIERNKLNKYGSINLV